MHLQVGLQWRMQRLQMVLGQTLRLAMVVLQQPVQAVVVHQQPVQKAKVRQLMPWLMVRMLWLGLTPEALELRLLLMQRRSSSGVEGSGGRAAGEDANPHPQKNRRLRRQGKAKKSDACGARGEECR